MSEYSGMPTHTPPRILIACYYFPPMGMGGVQRPLKFAKYLPEFGWDVTVIAPDVGSYHQFDPTLLDDLPATVRVERVKPWTPDRLPFKVRRQSSGIRGRGRIAPVLRRAWNQWTRLPDDKVFYARQACRLAQRLHREKPFDVVLTTSPPPSIHHVGESLRSHVIWVADFRDPWAIRAGDWGATPLHKAINQKSMQRIVRSADRLIAVNDGIAATLAQHGPAHPVEIIHNGYDESDFADTSTASARDANFTIVCPGTFSEEFSPEPIFAAVRAWKNSGTQLTVRISHVGASIGIDANAMADRCGLDAIFDEVGYLPHSQSIRAIVAADVIAIPIRDIQGSGAIVPGRIFEALRTLRPILLIAPLPGAAARLLQGVPGCWVVAPDDTGAGAAALHQIALLTRTAPVRRIADIARFDRRDQTRRLSELCALLADESRRSAGP